MRGKYHLVFIQILVLVPVLLDDHPDRLFVVLLPLYAYFLHLLLYHFVPLQDVLQLLPGYHKQLTLYLRDGCAISCVSVIGYENI